MVLKNYYGEKIQAIDVDSTIKSIVSNPIGYILHDDEYIKYRNISNIVLCGSLTNSVIGIAIQKKANLIITFESNIANKNSLKLYSRGLEQCYKKDIMIYEIGCPWKLEDEFLHKVISKMVSIKENISFFRFHDVFIPHMIVSLPQTLPLKSSFFRILRNSIYFTHKDWTEMDAKNVVITTDPHWILDIQTITFDAIFSFTFSPKIIEYAKIKKIPFFAIQKDVWLNEFMREFAMLFSTEINAFSFQIIEKETPLKIV